MKFIHVLLTTVLFLFAMTALVACGTPASGTDPNNPTNGISNPDSNEGVMSTPDGDGDGNDTDTLTDTNTLTDTETLTDNEMMPGTDTLTDTGMTPTMEAEATTAP